MSNTPPIRIQRRRTKGFNLQAQSPDGRPVFSVCRPGKWGNPFKIGEFYRLGKGGNGLKWLVCWEEKYAREGFKKIKTAEDAVQAHAELLETYPPKDISELRGKHLACFCPIGQPCHADTLLKLANQ
jgi:hypothetical protein